jgi:hypothetical protein
MAANDNILWLINNTSTPWGDWGDILWSGYLPWDDTMQRYYIERTGPYVPEIYISSGNKLIVTKAAMNKVEESKLKGITGFVALEKRKITFVDWQNWDKSRPISSHIENLREPEDLIDELPHNAALAESMPTLLLANISQTIPLIVDKKTSSDNPSDFIRINTKIVDNCDFFVSNEYIGIFVTTRCKEWLDTMLPGYIDFSAITRNP